MKFATASGAKKPLASAKSNSLIARCQRALGKLWFSTLSVSALIIVGALVFGVWQARYTANFFPLQKIVIESRFQQLSAEQIRAAAMHSLSTGFFGVDLRATRKTLQALPWVEQVEVRKVWPDTIIVKIIERQAVAQWGLDALVSSHGDVFHADGAQDMRGLVRLSGPDSRRPELLQFFMQSKAELRNLSLHLTHASFSQRGALVVQLSDGSKIILGRDQHAQRWARFLENLPTLRAKNQGQQLIEVDMRYTNGLAARFAPLPSSTPVSAPVPRAPSSETPTPAPARIANTAVLAGSVNFGTRQ
jgi:cell division protein FtsQ